MRMVDLIEKKKQGGRLNKQEISYWISGVCDKSIPDYQTSALLMAIIFKGMTEEETFDLTDAMLHSGELVDLSDIPGIKVDKHSTGGVGDKVTLVLGPMLAASGLKLAKMSGRGLGHTGGTLDKLESIPGLSTRLSIDDFKKQVRKYGIAVIGQTETLDPADRALYALRDVTGTVDSQALIASSIMSKKLAAGTDCILLDVKFGDGAFMKDIPSAKELATLMVKIGKYFGKNVRAEISSMEEPLGCAVGNILEVKEAIAALHGEGPADLMNICYSSGTTLLLQSGLAKDEKSAQKTLHSVVSSGAAFTKFCEMVGAQGGDVSYLEDPEKFPKAIYQKDIVSTQAGYISNIEAYGIGIDAMKLGAGREKEDDIIDYASGIVLKKKVGDKVAKGEPLATLYTDRPHFERIAKDIYSRFHIGEEPVEVLPVIRDHVE
jgi:pyrimidine-nucleoside phosphorylase